ncbi:MAG: hypothetical protein U5L98_00495 [Halomonas sp.]|uniref:FIST N-terminal domain-containing protein n=1 Tax=Halomonas sp. TaxID=1486246 RepID=UPI002ACDC948|nr:FIST N-terminal domain-containing protein [Halomonas sp.]MDZ7851151.1 hypothetical protein [Halomonas sp.]
MWRWPILGQFTWPLTAGCTTAGEITPGGYERGSIVAIGFDRQHFAVSCALVDDLSGFGLIRAQRLVDGLLDDFRGRALAPPRTSFPPPPTS